MKKVLSIKKNIFIMILMSIIFFATIFTITSTTTTNQSNEIFKLKADHIEMSISEYISPVLVFADVLAQDSFLISWLKEEKDRSILDSFIAERTGIIGCVGIDVVASKSMTCYQSGGTEVKLSEENDRDKWYYNLIDSGKEWSTEMFYDTTDGVLYIYHNIIVRDYDKKILGVLGFLLTYSDISTILDKFADSGVIGYMLNPDGEIYLHPDQSLIGCIDIYDYYGYLQKADPATLPRLNLSIKNKYTYKIDGVSGFLVVENSYNYLYNKIVRDAIIVTLYFLLLLYIREKSEI